MPKIVRIATTVIDDVLKDITATPAKAPSDYSLKEAIERLLPGIDELMKKGYNHEEISKFLSQRNLTISAATLKQYLREFNKSKPKQAKATGKSKAIAPAASTKVSESKTEEETEEKNESQVSPVPAEKVTKTDKSTSIDQPYKSPPKAGSEHFR